MPSDLLLEVGCEEIPSRYINPALKQLSSLAEKIFTERRIGRETIKCWATPRRLVLFVGSVDSLQDDVIRKLKGPPVNKAFDENGEPTRAASGFAKSAGVEISDLEKETIKDVEYLVVNKLEKGLPVTELLPTILNEIVSSIRFPRSMFWQEKGARFARPVRWLLALYGHKVVSFVFAGVVSGDCTRGHRFLSEGELKVKDPEDYLQVLEDNYVILDHRKREEIILRMLQDSAVKIGGRPSFSRELLEEVSFLVEYPEAVTGSFSEDFLKIPSEVLVTSMQSHQRFFPVLSEKDKSLMPFFIRISNNRYSDYTRSGYEKVLRARLADAVFFFEEDSKEKLEDKIETLKKVVYQESLGTVYNKSQRIVSLTRFMGEKLGTETNIIERAARAAQLSKADLVTDMVKEFPELQGVMGREYALLSGEDKSVAAAIYEHYLPRFSGDTLPESSEGVLVALADKLDTLAGCFYAGIIPTGSQDPYALRRQAAGAVSILLEKELPLSFREILSRALLQVASFKPESREALENDAKGEILKETEGKIEQFMEQRIRYLFQEEKGLPHDITDAVINTDCGVVKDLYKRALLLQGSVNKDYFGQLIEVFTRVNNLSRKAESEVIVDESLLKEEAEKNLWAKYKEADSSLKDSWQKEDYEEILKTFSSLKGDVDSFFDDVMVMAEDEAIRKNRLSMLLSIKKLFDRFADFSCLQIG